jgi:hypothetical protein
MKNKDLFVTEVTFHYNINSDVREQLFADGKEAQANRTVKGQLNKKELSQIGIEPLIDENGRLNWVSTNYKGDRSAKSEGLNIHLSKAQFNGLSSSSWNDRLYTDHLLRFEEAYEIQSQTYLSYKAELGKNKLQAKADLIEFLTDGNLRATFSNYIPQYCNWLFIL